MIAKLILLALGAAQGAPATVVDVAAARRATEAPSVAATVARMEQHAARGSTDALVGELRAVLEDPTLEPAAQEWLLESGLHMLRRLPVTAAARALTGALSTRAPRIFTRVEPEHGHQAAPLYDVGAVARYAERDWTRSEARASTAHSLGLGTPKALDAWLGQDESPRGKAVRDGILDAWRAASVAELARQRPAIVAAMRAGRDADRLALDLARRLRDPELYSLTIGYAEPMVALAAVQAAARDLDTGAALESARQSGGPRAHRLGRTARDRAAGRDRQRRTATPAGSPVRSGERRVGGGGARAHRRSCARGTAWRTSAGYER